MLLIADSGSTNTNWCFISRERRAEYFSTVGINPFFSSANDILGLLKIDVKPKISDELEQIFFYGAGVVNEQAGNEIRVALETLFPFAQVEIKSDLLAAARATLGHSKGIACILGTGSNSCLYDGMNITEHVSPLGYILGDEGSGAVIGRKLIADYLKKVMPRELSKKMKQQFPFEYIDFLNRVYREEKPNAFLAQFVPFLKDNINDDYCVGLVEDSFYELFSRNIFQYSDYRKLPISFVGSVAYHFSEQLMRVLKKQNLQAGLIIKDPMERLTQFHLDLY